MVLFTNYYEGFFVPNRETFRSYCVFHSENLGTIFTLRDCPYKFSEINVLSELKVK